MTIRESAEDYLEAMLMMRERHGYIRSVDVSEQLGVTKPSVSYAVKRLRENGYLLMDADGRITLTDRGEAIAQRIYERHRVLTEYLIEIGVPEEKAASTLIKQTLPFALPIFLPELLLPARQNAASL